MDRFSVSLEVYHELAQVEKGLPRVHHIEQHQKDMGRKWDIRRTPGNADGAELQFKRLLEYEIHQYVSA